jgi:hypothetical protein
MDSRFRGNDKNTDFFLSVGKCCREKSVYFADILRRVCGIPRTV